MPLVSPPRHCRTSSRARLFACGVGLIGTLAVAAGAAEKASLIPNNTPVLVVADAASAQAALDTARASGQALVADLTLGQEGRLVSAKSAEALKPGRYRLHALVASTSHDHLLGQAVALRLAAGAATNVFEPNRWFPEPGKLAPVRLDVVVDKPGRIPVAADWIVGDSKLDRMTYRDLSAARKAYLAQRQNALNQLNRRGGPDKAVFEQPPDDAGLGDAVDAVLAQDAPRLAPRALAGPGLPPHRLMLAGLVLERMSPVAVIAVRTDKAAYEPGATGRVIAELRNLSAEPVTAKLVWTVEDDSHPGDIVARHDETVSLAASEAREQTLSDALATAGIARLGRMRVEATVEGLRPDACRAPFVVLPPAPAHPPERSKKVFAHYMGCLPAGTGATRYHRLNAGASMLHDRGDEKSRHGGDIRNYPLVPQEPELSPEESADLEIRRAIRIGIDGFAIDAWAGGDGAKQVFDTLIKVAAAKDYPFEITVCLDPTCGGDIVKTVRDVLDRFGDNPKLARRDGKPLIFTYSLFGRAGIDGNLDERIPEVEREAAVKRMAATELGWHLFGQYYRQAEEQVGQPIYYTVDLCYFFHGVPGDLVKPDMPARSAAAIARHVGALNSFGFYGFAGKHAEVGKAVREAGAEWGWAGGMFQKESFLEVFTPKATDWLRFIWADTINDGATLVQIVTWNDLNENTGIAPAYNTRYTIYDLTGYFIEEWRAGKPPAVDHDRVYLTYAKYPNDAKSWPFKIRDRRDRALEVLTILTAPATVRLPGRNIEYAAPAGLHVRQFPVTPGPVIAEVVRDGKVAVRLESPEPITDRPFRQDVGLVCWSTEDERHWKADFGDKPMFVYSEYGDADNDGLPNWFEMYWFSKERGFKPAVSDDPAELLDGPKPHPVTRWLDLSTQTLVDPQADPDADGKSNLQEYLDKTDPTARPAPTAKDLSTDLNSTQQGELR